MERLVSRDASSQAESADCVGCGEWGCVAAELLLLPTVHGTGKCAVLKAVQAPPVSSP